MAHQHLMIVVEDDPELTLEELCQACSATPEMIQDIIEYGVITPINSSGYVRFNMQHLRRVRTIVHLQNDLQVNLAGAALALDLLEQLEQMRLRVQWLEKYLDV